ncbi:hypothetical protein TNCV_1636621 [Trichonephila clavipes]|nr:hypothetical protein TNCV_1636621 [Trichonephila clavipes]
MIQMKARQRSVLRDITTLKLGMPTLKVQPFKVAFALQHSRTSKFGAANAGNSSGTKFLEGPSGDSPSLPEPLQLR